MNMLAINWNVNPEIFRIGGFALRYYSLLFVGGFIVGWYIFKWYFRREKLPETLLDPLLMALLIGTIVGARLGHCLFYEPAYYLSNPVKILKVWEGGLASHGGAIGVLLAVWWYVRKYGRKYGFDMMWLLDRLVITICFAGCCIRLGNLFNSEIYGNATDLPWGFIFERRGETVAKHPTQLYEALSYLLLGLFLLARYRRSLPRLRKGWIFGFFLIVLFGMRFIIEFIKEDQVGFEQGMTLNMGQWLSVPFILAGIVILILSRVRNKPATLSGK